MLEHSNQEVFVINSFLQRPRWQLATVAATALVLLAAAWYLISPLFINVAVNESAPNSSTTATSSDTASKSGKFYNVAHDGEGTATLTKQSDGSYLLRLENFKVLNGPDLYVYTSSIAKPGESDVKESNSLSLGRLKGNVGAQNYVIPAGTPLEQLRSVVIWCKAFGVNFASASLE
jgi:Electron transfer DM13